MGIKEIFMFFSETQHPSHPGGGSISDIGVWVPILII